ncbi:prephenate dehydratase [Micrococcus sp.]|uniref:prephenate dehydratase n=1 Tax=Micrococcus sp. TaxID=1271 RepID=UPI002A91CDF2|nr:prephenate dehydratase [Micrococcus sp.]MDY6054670.1 prephenate dehydratase [Micrococcus sp.]
MTAPQQPATEPGTKPESGTGTGPAAHPGRPRYAFLGPAGTFTEAALRRITGPEPVEAVPVGSVLAALAAVRGGQAEFAVVPMENSVEGGVSATLDEISVDEGLQILAEALVPISFVLVGRPGVGLDQVRRVTTHTHAWAQVRGWMEAHLPQAEFTPAGSTAAGARALIAGSDRPDTPREQASGTATAAGVVPAFDAAVCAPLVAEQTGLPVLAERIEDVTGAVTRFVLVGPAGPLPVPTGVDRTTLTVPLPEDHPGALREILDQFATRGINLSRIESRPTGEGMGRYFFSIDLEGHLAEERVGAALAALHRSFPGVRFLGSYPRAERQPVAVPEHTTDEAYRAGREWVRALRSR